MTKERSSPPRDWTTINPEVVNIGSMRAMLRHELTVLLSIAVAIPIATLLGFFPLFLGLFIGALCILGVIFLAWVPIVAANQARALQRYLSWIFATQPKEERVVLLKPYPVTIAYRPVGTLLIAEIYGEDLKPEHQFVVTVPDEKSIVKASLEVTQPCKVHYDPETKDPVVIDLGTYRCWRAPGFASPPEIPASAGAGLQKPVRARRLHPTTAAVLWVVVFAFCFRFFMSPESFKMLDGRGNQATKWGFIDTKGRVVIQPTFDRVRGIGESSNIGPMVCRTVSQHKSFHEGLAAVSADDKHWGFIDKAGKFVIQPQFDDVGDFSDGLACVVVGNKCGFIDKSGKIVIQPHFDRVTFDRDFMYFKEGLCAVNVDPWSMTYIDKKGTSIMKSHYLDAKPFSDGLGLVLVSNNHAVSSKYIDKNGKTVLDIPATQRGLTKVDAVSGFTDGRALVRGFTQGESTSPRYWFIDKAGHSVGDGMFVSAKEFSDGLAAVMPIGSQKYGYIDHEGRTIIEAQFESAGEFQEDMAPAQLFHEEHQSANDLWGYIDKKGSWKVEPQFLRAEAFSEGRAGVRSGKGLSSKTGYVDKFGQLVIPANYNTCFPFSDGLAAVEMAAPASNK